MIIGVKFMKDREFKIIGILIIIIVWLASYIILKPVNNSICKFLYPDSLKTHSYDTITVYVPSKFDIHEAELDTIICIRKYKDKDAQ